MTWRIAIGSTDGKYVNEHFGRAKNFYIVDINSDGSWEYIGKGDVIPPCQGGEHSNEGMENTIKSISDCYGILVAKIGGSAAKNLEINHISVYEQPDFIDNAVEKLAIYLKKTKTI